MNDNLMKGEDEPYIKTGEIKDNIVYTMRLNSQTILRYENTITFL